MDVEIKNIEKRGLSPIKRQTAGQDRPFQILFLTRLIFSITAIDCLPSNSPVSGALRPPITPAALQEKQIEKDIFSSLPIPHRSGSFKHTSLKMGQVSRSVFHFQEKTGYYRCHPICIHPA